MNTVRESVAQPEPIDRQQVEGVLLNWKDAIAQLRVMSMAMESVAISVPVSALRARLLHLDEALRASVSAMESLHNDLDVIVEVVGPGPGALVNLNAG